jgi:hypothetical protein
VALLTLKTGLNNGLSNKSNLFSQETLEDFIQYYINTSISTLGNSVPSGFQRLDRTTYKNEMDIVVFTENNIVIASAFGSTFPTNNEAAEYNGVFYTFFEDNWTFFRSTNKGDDIYIKNNVYAIIYRPTKRDDGLIVAMIGFSKDINNL